MANVMFRGVCSLNDDQLDPLECFCGTLLTLGRNVLKAECRGRLNTILQFVLRCTKLPLY
jgi:hypothetical protein